MSLQIAKDGTQKLNCYGVLRKPEGLALTSAELTAFKEIVPLLEDNNWEYTNFIRQKIRDSVMITLEVMSSDMSRGAAIKQCGFFQSVSFSLLENIIFWV